MKWNDLQKNSENLLAQGIFKLRGSAAFDWRDINYDNYGNYLIIDDEINLYIGEGKNITARLKQQFNEKNSTFYKNYKKSDFPKKDINSFKIKFIETYIGRKELEEFGIVNLPTNLNKFQLNKCKKIDVIPDSYDDWDFVQNNYSDLLRMGEDEIFGKQSESWFDGIIPNCAGLYLVFDNSDKLIYVGESSNLKDRYDAHSNTTYFSALRRHIGKSILNLDFFPMKYKNKKREFLPDDDLKITEFLKNCMIKTLPVSFGRFELEEYLIRKYNPLLNKKENKV